MSYCLDDNENIKSLSVVNIKLKYCRKKSGLSIKQLATEAKLTTNVLEKFEDGTLNPTLEALERLAESLNTSTDFLLGKSAKR